jgi:hypothetical protein
MSGTQGVKAMPGETRLYRARRHEADTTKSMATGQAKADTPAVRAALAKLPRGRVPEERREAVVGTIMRVLDGSGVFLSADEVSAKAKR